MPTNLHQQGRGIQLQFICPYWGQEGTDAASFLQAVVACGYDGVEINLPDSPTFINAFFERLDTLRQERGSFLFIAQHITDSANKTPEVYLQDMQRNLLRLAAYQPDFINSHTGTDYYSFDDNCRIIETCLNIAQQTSVRILHETHRGRFSFHAASLLPYLQRFPELELVGDFSHFCTVSESLLHDQEATLQAIMPHVRHMHARVGSEQAPQVNDPFAPEWRQHLARFMGWWQQMMDHQKAGGADFVTISPEHGPFPYMPQAPYSCEPLSNQWEVNHRLAQLLREQLVK